MPQDAIRAWHLSFVSKRKTLAQPVQRMPSPFSSL
jgi:hypothetical protein